MLHLEDVGDSGYWRRCLASGAPYSSEGRFLVTGAGYRWFVTHAAPQLDSAGNIIRWFGTATDIHDCKLAGQEVRRLNEELEQRVADRTLQLRAANEELESFVYSVSHDLRSPLRGIDGWSLALLEDCGEALGTEGRDHLRRIRSESQRMGTLIDDLLKLSRVTRAGITRHAVDLSRLAEGIAGRLGEGARGRRIRFDIQPGLKAEGDERLLEVMLDNLLSNAVKFTAPREEARIEFSKVVVDGASAFSVRDNGVGFNMAYSDMLFGAFQRLHKVSDFPGSGLGLATVQRVVRKHGGRVWADSREGHGAAFYFTIPEHG
jgi:signal transduction histidine kinase